MQLTASGVHFRFRIVSPIAAASLLCAALTAHTQDAPKLPPPSLGPLVSYTYWPTQYVQWIGAELPYTMIELDVNKEAKSPILYVSLTDRASGKRIHYTNAEGLVASAKAQREEAYKTEIAFESEDLDSVGSVSTLRLTLADGKPLQWRFVQGSDISEQGSGLTPLPDAPIPVFVYREQGAVAGEGTALQIGETVSTADVWKEISHPPQFVAYRGAVTKSSHSLIFVPGKESWTIASAPAAFTSGSSWELEGATGNHRTVHIDKVDGMHATLSVSDRFQPSIQILVEATWVMGHWNLERVRYAPVREGDKHFAQLTYAPALPTDAGEAGLTLAFGKKKPIAEGLVKVAGKVAGEAKVNGDVDDRTLTLSFASPAWLHGKSVTETVALTAKSLTTIAHP